MICEHCGSEDQTVRVRKTYEDGKWCFQDYQEAHTPVRSER
jgi:hypothetical protein